VQKLNADSRIVLKHVQKSDKKTKIGLMLISAPKQKKPQSVSETAVVKNKSNLLT
jgi:hypothetical protein